MNKEAQELDAALNLLHDINRADSLLASEDYDLDARMHEILDRNRGRVAFLQQQRPAD